jgi:KAP family P-loop domain
MKPVVVAPGGDSVAAGLGSAMSSVSLEKLRKRISSALRETNKKLVILIDDIDRLEKSEIQALFRLIKLSADFENVVYVLAFDDAMVAAALGERFASDPAKHFVAGQNFLEKIVQVGLNLPPSTPEALQEYTFDLINRILVTSQVPFTRDQANALAVNFQRGILPRLKTPRMANRYANALEFSLTLLRGEVNAADLMLVEGIRIFYPPLYDAVRRNQHLLLSEDRKGFSCEQFVTSNTASLTKSEQEAAAWLLNALFPRTKTTGYGSDWENEWSQNKRICSSSYFDRYFSYAIRSTDVSDQSVQLMIDLASTGDTEKLQRVILEICSEKNASRVIEKIRAQESSLNSAASVAMAKSIAAVSDRLPQSDGMDFFRSPSLQASVLIRRLIRNLPAEDRLSAALEAIANARSIRFLCECVQWLNSSDEEKERVLQKNEETQLRKFGAQKIIERLSEQQQPIFESSPKDSGRILNMISWGLGQEAARAYVMSWLDLSEEHIQSFLLSFLPMAWTLETGIPHVADLRMEGYNEICQLADCDMIEAYLRNLFGAELDKPGYYVGTDVPQLRKVAHQFMYLRASAKATPATDPASPTQPSSSTLT